MLTGIMLQASLPYFFEYNIPRYFPSHFNFEEQISFFIWLVGFYYKLFSQQWAALVVDKSSPRSERGMKDPICWKRKQECV